MFQLVRKLWRDDRGALIATEWVFIATILIIGAITGFVAVRQAIITEVLDFAGHLNGAFQNYSFSGQANCESSGAGSGYNDPGTSISLKSTAATVAVDPNHACN